MTWYDIFTPEVQHAIATAIGAILTIIACALASALLKVLEIWKQKLYTEVETLAGLRTRTIVQSLVEAAEQKFSNEAEEAGKRKFEQVIAWAREKGIDVTEADIEAAVLALKSKRQHS